MTEVTEGDAGCQTLLDLSLFGKMSGMQVGRVPLVFCFWLFLVVSLDGVRHTVKAVLC